MPIIHFSKPFAHSTVIIIRANEKLKTIRHSCLGSFFLIALCSAFHVICECVYLYIFIAIQFHFSLLSIDTFRKFVVAAAVDWLKIRAKKGYRIKWVEKKRKKRVKAIRADFKWIISAVASTHTHSISDVWIKHVHLMYIVKWPRFPMHNKNNSMFYNVHKMYWECHCVCMSAVFVVN